jgi:hypothetical protein
MTLKTYTFKGLPILSRDLFIIANKLKEPYEIINIRYDNNLKTLVVDIEASDNFHNELSKLGYTSV